MKVTDALPQLSSMIEKHLGFKPHLAYSHPKGGSNSTQFLWWYLYFDLNSNQWVENRLIIESLN